MYSHNPLPIYISNPLQIDAECNIIAKLGIFFLVFSANIRKEPFDLFYLKCGILFFHNHVGHDTYKELLFH